MISRDELIEAFTDVYHNIGISELDYKWSGEYSAGDNLEPSEYPELEIFDATWEDISSISFRFMREYFVDNEEDDILSALKVHMPLEVEILSEHAIDDGDYLATTISARGKMTIISSEVEDNIILVSGKIEYVDCEVH